MNLKLIKFDELEATYRYGPILADAWRDVAGQWKFNFPSVGYHKAYKKGIDWQPIISGMKIPTFEENLKSFLKQTAKKEFEAKIEKLKDS